MRHQVPARPAVILARDFAAALLGPHKDGLRGGERHAWVKRVRAARQGRVGPVAGVFVQDRFPQQLRGKHGGVVPLIRVGQVNPVSVIKTGDHDVLMMPLKPAVYCVISEGVAFGPARQGELENSPAFDDCVFHNEFLSGCCACVSVVSGR